MQHAQHAGFGGGESLPVQPARRVIPNAEEREVPQVRRREKRGQPDAGDVVVSKIERAQIRQMRVARQCFGEVIP